MITQPHNKSVLDLVTVLSFWHYWKMMQHISYIFGPTCFIQYLSLATEIDTGRDWLMWLFICCLHISSSYRRIEQCQTMEGVRVHFHGAAARR